MNIVLKNMVRTYVMNIIKTYSVDINEYLISEIDLEVTIWLNRVNVIAGKINH